MRQKTTIFLVLGIIGSVMWLISDYMIGFLPSGILTGTALADTQELPHVLENAPLWRFTVSAIVQSLGMVFVMLGYWGIYFLLKNSKMLAALSLLSGIMAAIMGAVYHTIYVTAVWVYIQSGMSEGSFNLLTGIFKANSLLMTICGVGFTLLGLVLFVAVIAGKTILPKWACVFNMMIVYAIISFFEFPGHLSMGCIVMFSALLIFTVKSCGKSFMEVA